MKCIFANSSVSEALVFSVVIHLLIFFCCLLHGFSESTWFLHPINSSCYPNSNNFLLCRYYVGSGSLLLQSIFLPSWIYEAERGQAKLWFLLYYSSRVLPLLFCFIFTFIHAFSEIRKNIVTLDNLQYAWFRLDSLPTGQINNQCAGGKQRCRSKTKLLPITLQNLTYVIF